ncbi:MAG: hypothetical protein AVDCRST_MAG31-1622, partial [uncultured Sphingomonas sp.]
PHLAQGEDRLGGVVPTRLGRRGRGPAGPGRDGALSRCQAMAGTSWLGQAGRM